MKNCLLLITFCLASLFCRAQGGKPNNKIITGTKIVYLNYKDQKDSLHVPVVSDQYPALKEALSDKNIFNGDKTEELAAKYSGCGCGIISLYYDVAFANDNVISIVLYYDTMGDHPDSYQEWFTLDVHTGKPYSLTNELTDTGADHFAVLYKKKLKQNIEADKELKPDDTVETEVYDDLINTLNALTTKVMMSNYVFTDKGVLFKSDDVLPRDMHDHEPQRTLLIPYSQLKPYIKTGAVVLKK